jgi:hypothetical protein
MMAVLTPGGRIFHFDSPPHTLFGKPGWQR